MKLLLIIPFLSVLLYGCDVITPHYKQDMKLNTMIDSIKADTSTVITNDIPMVYSKHPPPEIEKILANDTVNFTILGSEVTTPESIMLPKNIKKSTKKYDHIINKAMRTYWLMPEYDFPFLKGLAYQESHLNDSAKSYVNAIGLYQFMSYTAMDMGATTPNERYDPVWSANAAVRYLESIRKMYGDNPETYIDQIALMASAYNLGPGGVRKRCKIYGWSFNSIYNSMPKETQNYFPSIKRWRSLIYYGLL